MGSPIYLFLPLFIVGASYEPTPGPSSPRRPIVVFSDRDTKDESKEKDEREKPPTIILKAREPSTSKDEWPLSPKGQELEFAHTSKSGPEVREKKIEPRPTRPLKPMTDSVKLLDEHLEIKPLALDFLHESNTNFVVIGAIGMQGVGKSLVLNLLAQSENKHLIRTILEHNEDDETAIDSYLDHLSLSNGYDKSIKESWLKFKLRAFEHVVANTHCTKGIDMYVTKDRVIYLDCQALWSPSLVEDATGSTSVAKNSNGMMTGLQLAAFMMSVCHVIIGVQEWIVDYNFIRYIQTAEMLRPTLTMPAAEGVEPASNININPHLVLLHNHCRFEDYLPITVKKLQDVYRLAFAKSSLQVYSGIYMYSELSTEEEGVDQLCPNYTVEACGKPINMFLLPEIEDESDPTIFRGHPPLDKMMDRLRRQILGASRHQLTNAATQTEKAWFHFCNRAWETIKTSSFFIEYERLLP